MNVEIYTKPACSACTNAKTLLRNSQIPFREYKLNEDFTREHILSIYPDVKTYPVVIIDGMRVGGYSELKECLNEDSQDGRKFLVEGNYNGNF